MRSTRTAAQRRVGLWIWTVALTLSVACNGEVGPAVSEAALSFDREVFEGAIVPTEGHPGWTRGTYDVTHDGAAVYEIPLDVPQGRAGMQPDLALVYRSGAPNGHLGVGWSIRGLSTITRCGRTLGHDGVTDGVRWDGEEFCLDGVRLIGESKGEFPDGGDFREMRGGFSRIDREGEPTSPTSFRVWDRDGRIRTYGTDEAVVRGSLLTPGPDGALVASTSGEVTYAWLLRRIEDRAGNAIELEYETLEHPLESERVGDHDDPPAARETRVTRIVYTSHPKAGAGQRAVEFRYEDRRDPIVSFVRGLPLATTSRISSILMRAPDPLAGPLRVVREYVPEYDGCSSSTGRTLLCGVRECDGSGQYEDDRGAALSRPVHGVCREAVGFEWTQNELSLAETDTEWEIAAGSELLSYSVGDFTGDGRDDLLYRDFPWRLAVNHPTGWSVREIEALEGENGGRGLGQGGTVVPYDHDGHGRVGIYYVRSATPDYYLASPDPGERDWEYRPRVWLWDIAYSHGTVSVLAPPGVVAHQFQRSLCSGEHSASALALGDFDGDGVSDRLGGCRTGSGWSWGLYRHLADQPFGTYGARGPSVRAAQDPRNIILELDGDGRADFLSPRGEGELWQAASLAPGARDFVVRNVDLSSDDELVFLDVNGDGLSDVLTLRAGPAGFQVRLNTGAGFTRPYDGLRSGETRRPWQDYFYVADVFVADFDRDGRQDFALRFAPPDWLEARGDRVGTLLLHLSDGEQFRTVEAGAAGAYQRFRYDGPGLLYADELEGDGYDSDGWPATGPLDADGDGFVDYMFGTRPPGGATRIHTRRLVTGAADLLQAVRIGGNEQVRFTWSPAGRASVDGERCEYPLVCSSGPFQVVSSHVDARNVRYDHAYVGPRTDLRGWGWIGFEQHIRVEQSTGTITEWTFDRDAYAQSTGYWRTDPVRVRRVVTDPDTRRLHLRDERTTYDSRPMPGAVHSVTLPSRHEIREYEAEGCLVPLPIDPAALPASLLSCVARGAKDVNLVRAQTVALDYDEHGTLDEVETTVPDVGVTRVSYELENRVEDYLLGLRERAIVESETPDGRRAVRESRYSYDSRGILKWIQMNPSLEEHTRTIEIAVDSRGLLRDIHDYADGQSRRTSFEYDEEHVFLSRVRNSLDHESIVAIHPGLGVTVAEADSNGLVTTHRFDGFGRPRSSATGGLEDRMEYRRDPQGLEIWAESAGGGVVRRVHDWRGRPVVERQQSTEAQWARSDVAYDALGRVARVSAPYFESSGARPTELVHYEYDVLGRPTRVSHADEVTLVSYRGRDVTVKNPRGHRTTRVHDMAGRVLESFAAAAVDGGVPIRVRFEYGPFDRLDRRYDQARPDRTWEYEYDDVGNLRRQVDPDAGERVYVYSARGELRAELDPATLDKRHTWERDRLGRLTTESDVEDGVVTYEWDVERKGLLWRATREKDRVVETYRYDDLLRLEGITTEISERAYDVQWSYDERGRVETLWYPDDALALRHVYDESTGLLERLQDENGRLLWRVTRRDASQRALDTELGNGIATFREYHPETGRLRRIETSGPRGFVQDLAFDHDAAGNVIERRDSVLGEHFRFTYDLEDRIDQVLRDGAVVEDFDYDAAGNLLRTRERSFEVQDLHRLDGVSYDDRGRVRETRDGESIEWTSFDLPRSVSYPAASARYLYTASGARAQQSGNGSITDYVNGIFERRRSDSSYDKGVGVARIYADGELVAERHVDAWSSTRTLYVHSDQIGNVDAVTDDDGRVVERFRYQPFGARVRRDEEGRDVGGEAELASGFTGHDHDATGFVDAGGRLYDPDTGRFLTPDPIIRDPYDRQSLNGYSYVENRPLTWTDPSGFVPGWSEPFGSSGGGGGVGGVLGWIANAIVGAVSGAGGGEGSRDSGSELAGRGGLDGFDSQRQSAPAYRPTNGRPAAVVDGQAAQGGAVGGGGGAGAHLAYIEGYDQWRRRSPLNPDNIFDFIHGVGNGFTMGHEAPDPNAGFYYNFGSFVGNVGRAAAGVASMVGGGAIIGGGGVISLGSLGTLAIPGGAAVALGSVMIAGGAYATGTGAVGAVGSVVAMARSRGGDADAERDRNIARGVPESQLGPSGRPKIHVRRSSTRSRAADRAVSRGTRGTAPEEHTNPTRGSSHFHPSGSRHREHYEYPRRRGVKNREY